MTESILSDLESHFSSLTAAEMEKVERPKELRRLSAFSRVLKDKRDAEKLSAAKAKLRALIKSVGWSKLQVQDGPDGGFEVRKV